MLLNAGRRHVIPSEGTGPLYGRHHRAMCTCHLGSHKPIQVVQCLKPVQLWSCSKRKNTKYNVNFSVKMNIQIE